MTTRQVLPYAVDKTQWRRGPWDDEDDAEMWTLPSGHTGVIARNAELGTWCGYVGLPPGEVTGPLPGVVSYDDTRLSMLDEDSHRLLPEGMRWLGFHCAHGNHYMPGPLTDIVTLLTRSGICVMPGQLPDGVTEVQPGRVLVNGVEFTYVPQPFVRVRVRLLDERLAIG